VQQSPVVVGDRLSFAGYRGRAASELQVPARDNE
jgi:hypothetical protein